MISVIIPTYNEEKFIGKCLQSISKQKQTHEIIIVDCGSKDQTLKISANFTHKIIRADRKNLGYQANLGAENAKGNIFLFFHADSFLPKTGLQKINDYLRQNQEAVGGSFTMIVEGDRFFYKILSLGGNIFTRISKLYFGDRGLFIRKTTFNKMSGFKEMPIMEDVNFSAKMNKEGKTSIIKGPVITSGRKFEKEPFWKILFLIFWSLSAYMIGVDPLKIRKKYYGF